MKAIDGIDAGHAFMPGDGWCSEYSDSDTFGALLVEHGFIPRSEPPLLLSKDSMKYSRGGIIVAGEGGSPSLEEAWRFYEHAFLSARAPQLTSLTVVSPLDRPLSLITNSGNLDSAFTAPVPNRVVGLGVSIREEVNSEWFLNPNKQQMYILRRRFWFSSEGIMSRIHHVRDHLPPFPAGLLAELSLGAPVAAVSRCTSPRETPAIERIGNDMTVLLWSNVRVTLVDQVISHKQLTHKTVLLNSETFKPSIS
jgi:hypothetical protein